MTRAEAKREADLNTWIIKKFRKIRADEVPYGLSGHRH